MKALEDYKNGQLLLIDKPLGWTSFQVVNKLRWHLRKTFNIKKIKVGHAGTLDPLATGLLIICTGKMTKQIEQYQAQKKVYSGSFTLGSTTPSFDMETEINQQFPTAHITEELIRKTTKNFIGETEQYPPVYSALKKDGKRLYEFASVSIFHPGEGDPFQLHPADAQTNAGQVTAWVTTSPTSEPVAVDPFSSTEIAARRAKPWILAKRDFLANPTYIDGDAAH